MNLFFLLLPFLSAALYGLGYILVEKLLKTVDIVTFTLSSSFAMFVTCLAVACFKKGSFSFEFLNDQKILIMFLIAIIVNAAGWIVTQLGLKYTSAEYVGFAELSYPVFTLAFLVLIFGQREFNWQSLIGGAIVMAGAVLMVMGQSAAAGGK